MSAECYPITVLPHISQLYRDYLAMAESPADSPVRQWYGCEPFGGRWLGCAVPGGVQAAQLADALDRQSRSFGAAPRALENIARLRDGARAVVTGQQVGLLGGPLLTILKAATAIARAQEATRSTGHPHVPVFWLATEDHDLAEIDQVALLTKTSVETLRTGLHAAVAQPVGQVALGPGISNVIDLACELLEWAPVADVLREIYTPGETFGRAFARLMAWIFADQGLIVMDAAGRDFHALGSNTLRYAIEHAAELETALLSRTNDLVRDGYHAQVMVAPGSSLLFLVDSETGERQVLKRTGSAEWKAGRKLLATADLLQILETEPERLSPNALLRPVFQDTILPTAAYVGGPAEVAYFAQSAVLYDHILGRVTPVLPRLSATLLEPAIATVMNRHEVHLPDALTSVDDLAQRLGARSMPIDLKRKLAAVGNALDTELNALTQYLSHMDHTLGRSAEVSGNKMRYQMNRLRRITATHELEKERSLRRHAEAIVLNVFPEKHPQERLIGGIWYIARYGQQLIGHLVHEAATQCPGHVIIRL